MCVADSNLTLHSFSAQESSVEKFGAVHTKVKEGNEGKETTRGVSLRELQRFFKEHDMDEGYAGLRRIADEDGTAVWTILKETEVAAQLEQRTEERRKEDDDDSTAALGLALANCELVERLKAENQLLINAAADPKKDTSCGCVLS